MDKLDKRTIVISVSIKLRKIEAQSTEMRGRGKNVEILGNKGLEIGLKVLF
jgi:hypothetical protein